MHQGKQGQITPEWWRERLRWMIDRPDCPPDVKKRCQEMLAEASEEAPGVVIRIIHH